MRAELIKNAEWKLAAALDAAVTGGIFHAGRGDGNWTRTCHRCGDEDTAMHRLITCPKLATHSDDRIQKTNPLARDIYHQSAKETYLNVCWWGRAIVPNPQIHHIQCKMG